MEWRSVSKSVVVGVKVRGQWKTQDGSTWMVDFQDRMYNNRLGRLAGLCKFGLLGPVTVGYVIPSIQYKSQWVDVQCTLEFWCSVYIRILPIW